MRSCGAVVLVDLPLRTGCRRIRRRSVMSVIGRVTVVSTMGCAARKLDRVVDLPAPPARLVR